MKRRGFTLAEVLITLGIIGVVAALTAPALVQNSGSAQTGPKLAKAVSTWETANEMALTEQGANSIRTLSSPEAGLSRHRSYMETLARHMKINFLEDGVGEYSSSYVNNYDGSSDVEGMGQTLSGAKYLSKDGILYAVFLNQGRIDPQRPLYRQSAGEVVIDINGFAEPNRWGKDAFYFQLAADGSLCPYGAACTNDMWPNSETSWKEGDDLCNETTVTTGWTCAGSIFENNLKVIYQ